MKYNPETYIDIAYLQGQLITMLETRNRLQDDIIKKEEEIKKLKEKKEREDNEQNKTKSRVSEQDC